METQQQFEYGFYDDCLKECSDKFGNIFGLPIIDSPYIEIAKHYQKGNILDLGSGKKKPLGEIMKDKLNDGNYYSLDTDPRGKFDFNDIKEIPKDLKFDLIVANQVFEHLDIEESIDLMIDAGKLLTDGGKIIVTVPNISHPNRQRSNITHKTPWGFWSLYMPFKMANLEVVKVARYSKRHPKGLIEKIIIYYVSRVYRMDWCDSILMIGKK